MEDYKYSLDIMRQELKSKWICPEIKYAFKTSVEALEKQIPKSAVKTREISQACPNCGKAVRWGYCSNCGQRIKY